MPTQANWKVFSESYSIAAATNNVSPRPISPHTLDKIHSVSVSSIVYTSSNPALSHTDITDDPNRTDISQTVDEKDTLEDMLITLNGMDSASRMNISTMINSFDGINVLKDMTTSPNERRSPVTINSPVLMEMSDDITAAPEISDLRSSRSGGMYFSAILEEFDEITNTLGVIEDLERLSVSAEDRVPILLGKERLKSINGGGGA